MSPIPNHFRAVRELDSTLNSVVTLVTTSEGSEVVLKQPSPSKARQRRFKREVNAMRQFAGPNTMPVLDHSANFAWYTMPVAEATLAERPIHGDLPFALTILDAICESLRPAHAIGQVHRDLKPHNILWLVDDQPGRWVVADFGEVRNEPGLTTNPLTRTSDRVGTDGWAAPEQTLTGHNVTPAADVWAAAAVVSWLLTESAPGGGQVPPPKASHLAGVIVKATRRNPNDRYPSLDAFAAALRDAQAVEDANVTLQGAIDEEDFEQLSKLISDDGTHPSEIANHLPSLTLHQLHRWYEADPGGFCAGILAAVERVAASDMNSKNTSPLLTRGVDAIRVLLKHRRFDDVRELTTAVSEATVRFTQWTPAKELVQLIGSVKAPAAADAVDVGLRVAGARDYLRSFAQDKWERDEDSDLLRGLRK
jgi:serine/threonine-protein kinase